MAQATDAQLRLLVSEYKAARQAIAQDQVTLAAAAKALAGALTPNGEIIVQGWKITANASADDVAAVPVRVVV